jgi:pimeloyl-ACP methyl ester carboxylesterase
VCLHGITDTWRTWELVLPALEQRHDVLAVTLAGHAGGPPFVGEVSDTALTDAVELAMDQAGFDTAHILGNSLGGYVALQLAARGRARKVVAMAPAGGWLPGDDSYREVFAYFASLQETLKSVAPNADAFLAAPGGRRTATQQIVTNFEHIPVELIAHQILGAARCEAVLGLIDYILREGWSIDAERIDCPVRIVWGSEDRILTLPASAARFRSEWLPQADWIELDGIGHCPQLDVPLEAAQLVLGFTDD